MKELIDKIDNIHSLIAKSNLSSKNYQDISVKLIEVKECLRNFKIQNKLLSENCEHYQHDHCNCIGKFCELNN